MTQPTKNLLLFVALGSLICISAFVGFLYGRRSAHSTTTRMMNEERIVIAEQFLVIAMDCRAGQLNDALFKAELFMLKGLDIVATSKPNDNLVAEPGFYDPMESLANIDQYCITNLLYSTRFHSNHPVWKRTKSYVDRTLKKE